ncbi:nuclear pore complex protein Nup155-like [Amphibalanus amphitrite]|uniref:nuclear pore complex protein Nup155-like n=1 Tax=Amphibalanus amphitrite TaxID=1232801 RepID=UPI001C9255D2|nr:nuclear pore complex protein Nup155-like [Amphibalanus amphitrite]XP_043230117.1 nuclear pore complex protein Nup155-like [Amphibalanus amphitrite]XP_043230118.1 nuclear pore complex protein Nup155-like [Amphibalanus amphitrite]
MPASPAVSMSFSGGRPLAPAGAGLQEALSAAGATLERLLAADTQFPSLADRLRIGSQPCPTVSGLHEADYPSLGAAGGRGGLGLRQISAGKKVPLPAELVEHFNHLQCNCMMGLFPELDRAWLTIDNDIYVWLFETGANLAYYDGLSETILAVGLVRPRPGVFQAHIQHLLCLATPLEIVLLGVTMSRPAAPGGPAEMHVLPEPLFSIASDGAYVTTVVGTPSGRVFLGAKDGCLYELVYQATESWFSRRCRKINHSSSALSVLVPTFLSAAFSDEDPLLQLQVDASRNVLYTRSEKGTVQVYDLGDDGQQTVRVAALSQFSIVQAAEGVARTVDPSNFRPVLDISPVTAAESAHVQLVVTTGAGVRLYFSTAPTAGGRPTSLQLRHIRLPPGFAANATQRPAALHMARYSDGTALLVAAQSEELDVLWLLSGDAFPAAGQLTELQSTLALDWHTWALQPLPERPLVRCEPAGAPRPPLVVTQHARLPRRYVALSTRGVQVLEQLRPVDQLRALLEDAGRPDSDAVRAFFTLHTEAQACATCLILACSDAPQDAQLAAWAERAFLLYGGEPQVVAPPAGAGHPSSPHSTSLLGASFHPQQVSTPQPSRPAPFAAGSPPPALSAAVSPDTSLAAAPAEVLFSGKHDGLYLYAARLLRPVWASRVVREFSPGPGQVHLVSAASSEELGWLSGQLELLSRLLQRHSPLQPPFADTVSTQQLQQRMNSYLEQDEGGRMAAGRGHHLHHQQALQAERQSLLHLRELIAYTRQVLGLVKIVTDHQTHVVTEALSREDQSALRLMTFRDLTLSGRTMCTQLIAALIGRYLSDNGSTEAVSAQLRALAPAVFREEDAISSQASEKLMAARNASSPSERQRLLGEALALAKRVAGQLQLAAVCQQFQAAHDYEGVVELVLAAAEKRDPQEVALHYYRNGEPAEDLQGRQAFRERDECYTVVLEMLSALVRASHGQRQSPVPARPGAPPAAEPADQPQQAQRQAERVIDAVLKSRDELLHVAVYNWMVVEGMSERLLQVRSPYIEPFLTRSSGAAPGVQMLDLLWKHYERSGNHLAAAKVLAKLAERHGTDVDLARRIEYLARAVLCVKSSQMQVAAAASQGEFLHELEEKVEVARVQWRVLEAARGRSPEAETRLNADLLDVTALYSLCERLGLARCQLAIVVCAGHRDAALVRDLWRRLLAALLQQAGSAEAAAPAVTELAREYRGQPAYCPLDTIVRHLEEHSCRHSMTPPEWAAAALAEAGVSLPELLSVYQSLYSQDDPMWTDLRRPQHLLQAIHWIISRFSERPDSVAARDRRAFISTCQDQLASYLTDLRASSDPDAGLLAARLKDTKAALERLRQAPAAADSSGLGALGLGLGRSPARR